MQESIKPFLATCAIIYHIDFFFQKLHYQELIHRKDEIELKRQKSGFQCGFPRMQQS